MSKKVLVVLANGFEEIESVVPIDICRRANMSVTVAALDNLTVVAAHDIKIQADVLLKDVQYQVFDVIILPGGDPGTSNLEKSDLVKEIVMTQFRSGRMIAAICAAPRILEGYGLLRGRTATCYPGTKPKMQSCTLVDDPVVVDGNILTSQAPGTAMAMSYKIVEILQSPSLSTVLQQAMLYKS
jgi:4-methyl-5(b-hydroxyethyl)-thiazole monophosphate biosynthesis